MFYFLIKLLVLTFILDLQYPFEPQSMTITNGNDVIFQKKNTCLFCGNDIDMCLLLYIENTMLVSDIIKFIRQGLEKNESEALPRFPFFRAEPDKFYNIRHLFGILFIMFTFFYLFFSSICLFLSFCLENARGNVTSL